jgi:hypothetical protein
MYKIKYKIAEWLVRFEMFFTDKNSYQYYENLYVLENIQKEKYIETISKQMKKDWTNFYN